jgi:hypothetical protein
MKTPTRTDATIELNHLRLGATYRAVTPHGAAVGEYLGLESPHGDAAILLRHRAGTDSIPLDEVTTIELMAA